MSTLASSSPAAAAAAKVATTDAPRELAKKSRSRSQQQQQDQHRRSERKRRRSRPPPSSTSSSSSSLFSRLLVRSDSSQVQDPRELQTILLFSLRNLWGDLEAHSGHVQVTKRSASSLTNEDGNDDEVHDNHPCARSRRSSQTDSTLLFEVICLTESVNAVRAALTMVTPPPYLEEGVGEGVSLFRFDVLEEVQQQSISDQRNG